MEIKRARKKKFIGIETKQPTIQIESETQKNHPKIINENNEKVFTNKPPEELNDIENPIIKDENNEKIFTNQPPEETNNIENLPNPFYIKNVQEKEEIINEPSITQLVLQKKDEINPESNITQLVLQNKDEINPETNITHLESKDSILTQMVLEDKDENYFKRNKTIIAYNEKGYCPFSCIPILEKNDFSYYEDDNMPE